MSATKIFFIVFAILTFKVEVGFSQTATERKQESVIISNSKVNAVKAVDSKNDASVQTITPARQATLNSSGRNAQPVAVEKTENVTSEEGRTKQTNSGLRVNNAATSETELQKASPQKPQN